MNEQSNFDIGDRMRFLRKKARLTLRDLSERSGLSINAISRIEKNLTSPTVSTLHRLSMALGIPVSAFFQDEITERVVLIRSGSRKTMRMKGRVMEMLGSGIVDPLCEPLLITVDGGEKTTTGQSMHPGEEFAYCLQGSITFYISGRAYELNEGDSLLFKSDLGHSWENKKDAPAKILLIIVKCENQTETKDDNHNIVHEYVK